MKPDSLMRFSARSRILTGLPISSTKISPPFAHGPGLQHKAHRLGDRHKIAHDVRVGHRDRTARRDLLFKQRQHRAVGAQHIAEAHRHKLGFAVLRPAPGRSSRTGAWSRPSRWWDSPPCPWRSAQNARAPVFVRRTRHIVGAEHVVLDRFLRRCPPSAGTCLCAAAWNTTSGR